MVAFFSINLAIVWIIRIFHMGGINRPKSVRHMLLTWFAIAFPAVLIFTELRRAYSEVTPLSVTILIMLLIIAMSYSRNFDANENIT